MLNRRLGRPQRGVREIEQMGEEAVKLRAAVADHSKEDVTSALRNAVRLYMEMCSDEPPTVRTRGMPRAC